MKENKNYLISQQKLQSYKDLISSTVFQLDDPKVNKYLTECRYPLNLHEGVNGMDLLRRPGIHTKGLLECIDQEIEEEYANKCDIDVKYEGYIAKAKREANKLKSMELQELGKDFDYREVDNLSLESRQKLEQYKPATIGQASRISGVNPADIAVLAIAIKQGKGRKKK